MTEKIYFKTNSITGKKRDITELQKYGIYKNT